MASKFRALAPSKPPANPQPPEPSKSTVPFKVAAKRRAVSIACDVCRKLKARCDGARPTCQRCRDRGIICVYQADESRLARVDDLQVQRDAAAQENTRLWQLFRSLKELPRHEADAIITQLRSMDDPAAMLRLARNVAPPVVVPGPAFAPRDKGEANTRLPAINMRALMNSKFRVSARPWTLVAGDGLVSDLISSFFTYDHPFFVPCIDRDAFLADMRSNDPTNAVYCSPLLVNAICASRSFTSKAAKSYSAVSGEDIGAKFLNEAKKMLNLENNRPSLPTAQALAIMFTVTAYRGADRQGLAYRYSAYEMLDRLNLPAAFTQASDDYSHGRRTKAILSRAHWGLFCFESLIGNVYCQQSLIPPPGTPRYFEEGESPESIEDGSGVFPGSRNSRMPLTLPGVLGATCDISLLQYRIMKYNAACEDVGSDRDLATRRQFYSEAQELAQRLPGYLKEDENFTPQTCFLRTYLDEVIICIWRVVHGETIINSSQGITVNDLLIYCVQYDVASSNRYAETFELSDYSCMVMCGLYNGVLILVERLTDARIHDTFIQACALLRRITDDFPLASFILQGVTAIAWSIEIAIPARALPYLQNLNIKKKDQDIPLTFGIPETVVVRRMLANEDTDPADLREMGKLLLQWSNLTID